MFVMKLCLQIYSLFFGKKVGCDYLGNSYYQTRHRHAHRRAKRWVIYRGLNDASKVPAEWHGWLHHTYDRIPSNRGIPKFSWQKTHIPNLTGTVHAYTPRPTQIGVLDTLDYQPWTPSS
ncbi:MAG: NADH:ubiquinone oxidoreductase subunit NDUFA12 [Alphaproteobacteria bacterium]|nr:NADH:ubiquinone oxidoreductase subunit NDUFA12 [Alphaproteobacteria bacterium]